MRNREFEYTHTYKKGKEHVLDINQQTVNAKHRSVILNVFTAAAVKGTRQEIFIFVNCVISSARASIQRPLGRQHTDTFEHDAAREALLY